ncbi:UNVERIFIED_CONTAM: hypothetical protein NCL1_09429 [Trichonephila clavipes]
MKKYDRYSERVFVLLHALGKKAFLEWSMKDLIGSSCVCPKCGRRIELRERTGKKANDGFEWYCRNQSTVKEDNHHVSRSIILRHIGNMFGSSLNTEIKISVLKY